MLGVGSGSPGRSFGLSHPRALPVPTAHHHHHHHHRDHRCCHRRHTATATAATTTHASNTVDPNLLPPASRLPQTMPRKTPHAPPTTLSSPTRRT